jgi:hypothetical protein
MKAEPTKEELKTIILDAQQVFIDEDELVARKMWESIRESVKLCRLLPRENRIIWVVSNIGRRPTEMLISSINDLRKNDREFRAIDAKIFFFQVENTRQWEKVKLKALQSNPRPVLVERQIQKKMVFNY